MFRPIWLWFIFCFKQKTADEMRISDWSSDVCSSDLGLFRPSRPDATPFTIVNPPPNVTGAPHIGHALDNTLQDVLEIGRASCRERVCQYVSSSVVAVSLKKKTDISVHTDNTSHLLT